MVGLDQVSDDADCFDQQPSGVQELSYGQGLQDPSASGRGPDPWEHLARTIEGEIIPRLLMVHRPDQRRAPPAPPPAGPVTHETIAAVALSGEGDALLTLVHRLMGEGTTLETIYLDLLAPAARRLGDLWLADEVTFTDVTIALCRLQRVMRTLARAPADPLGPDGEAPARVMLVLAPGEQHSFGLLMLEEFFRREGFEVDVVTGAGEEEILSAVQAVRPAAVGISVSVDTHLPTVERLVRRIRSQRRGPAPLVMVGGRCFVDDPGLAARIGADFTAVDGRQAIRHIQNELVTGSLGG
jgi:MerR family transcriptional regulator, light-induced transcriptional regulator